ncbi:MAG: enoyl-CoA hydratase/isomerase family protein [Spongiibacteraceae bacterium]
MNERLDVTIHGHVAQLVFQNPPNNFATVGLLRLIADALEKLDADAQIRAIVLASEGKPFCAGADLVSPNGFGAQGSDPLREFYDQALRIFAARKPIIAAVQGAAIGAGLGLVVAADFRVASVEARFSANFTKLGFHPGFGLTCTLPRIIGQQRAAEMFLTAERYKAEDVAAWGLVDRIVDARNLRESALAFANEIAVNAPLSLLATRATLRGNLVEQVRATLVHEHAEQIKLQPTEDFAEGIRAVGERRPGNFVGR